MEYVAIPESVRIVREDITSIKIVGAGEDTTVVGGTFPFGLWSTIEGGCIDGYIRECLNMVGHWLLDGYCQVVDKILGMPP